MADANGRDLTQFERWYDQNGTPELSVDAAYDQASQTYRLSLEQTSSASDSHQPFHMPIRIALLGQDGNEIKTTLEGPITVMVPATVVQLHQHAHILIDEAAASSLEYYHHHGIIEPK